MESNKDNHHFKHSQLSRQEIANTNTHTHTRSPCKTHSQVKESSLLFPPQSVPVIHTMNWSSRSISSPSHPSVTPPLLCSALCASWFRPAVAALAASGADPPHFNASDIYLGRTTGGRGGGGGGGERDCVQHRWMWILLLWILLTPIPPTSMPPPLYLHAVLCAVFC